MRTQLVLLRHAQTAHNAEGRLQGQLDLPLDAAGRRQARSLAAPVRALGPDLVISSDLARATETARLLGVAFETDPRLREIDLGAWQGLTLAEAAQRFPEEHAAWRGRGDVARGGGETYGEVADRALAAVEEALARLDGGEPATLLVVSHGGTIRAVVARLVGLPRGRTWPIAGLGNGRWARLERGGIGWRLLEYGWDPLLTEAGTADDVPSSVGFGWRSLPRFRQRERTPRV